MRSIYMSLWLVNSLMLVISELDNAVKIQFCEYFQYFRKSCMELHNTIFRICQKCIFFIEYNGNKVFCEKIWIVLLCSNMVAHLLFTIGLFEFVVYLWNFFLWIFNGVYLFTWFESEGIGEEKIDSFDLLYGWNTCLSQGWGMKF